jgi:hypothetical protein
VQTINAARMPGIHPARVRTATTNIVPQPLSKTANGGKRMHSMALQKPILVSRFCQRTEVFDYHRHYRDDDDGQDDPVKSGFYPI